MARTNIEVIVTVRDGASKPLDNINKKVRNTGNAAKDASLDFTKFNKTLFTTAAFVGTFLKAFSSLRESLSLGAELDRVTRQFERVLGPRGEFIDTLSSTTNSVVDEFTAIESGLHLGQLGIAKSSNQAASMIAKMAVASRMAGKDASEGVKDLTSAIEDGNVAKLQEYGIIRKNDPMYMAQLATLNKAGGIYGATIVKQQQLALVMKALTEHTKEHMFMWMSTGELVDAAGKKFKDVRQHVGIFLATALRPLIEKLIPFLDKIKNTLFYLYRNDKQIMFLTRSVLMFTGALGGLIATLGTLKLSVKLLGFAGIGLPGLITAVLVLSSAFLGLTSKADGVVEKFRVIGAVVKGVYELVSNLDPETGLSKISKSTKDLLDKYGLLGFVKTISRILAIIKVAATDIFNVFKSVAGFIDDTFGGLFNKFKDIMSSFTSTWTTWWTTDALSPIEKFARAGLAILGPLLAFFTAKWAIGGLFSKFTGIGKNDGSSPAKALWVQTAGGMLGGLGGALGGNIGKLGALVTPTTAIAAAVGAVGSAYFSSDMFQEHLGALDKLTGGAISGVDPKITGMAEQLEKIRSGQKQTQVSVPTVPADDLSILTALRDQMEMMDSKSKEKMQSAIEKALESKAPGGGFIDPDEYKNFETILKSALDSSENLTVLANKAKENRRMMKSSPRDM